MRGRISLIVVQVNHLSVFSREGNHRFQYLPVILQKLPGLLHQLIQRDGPAAEKAFDQIFAGIDGDADEPGFFMFRTLKGAGGEGVFQKNVLEDIFGIRIIFQLNHTQPPDGIRIPVDGGIDFLFTSHGISSASYFVFTDPVSYRLGGSISFSA